MGESLAVYLLSFHHKDIEQITDGTLSVALQGDLKRVVCCHRQPGMFSCLNELNSLNFKVDLLSGIGRVKYGGCFFTEGLRKLEKE